MNPVVKLLWAKSDRENPTFIHPLICHLIDATAVCRVLCRSWPNFAGIDRFADWMNLDTDTCIGWLSFWVGAHDIGKATPAFQRLVPDRVSLLQQAGLKFPPIQSKTPHGILSTAAIRNLGAGDATYALDLTLAHLAAHAVGSHHGRVITDQHVLQQAGRFAIGDGPWADARRKILDRLWDFATGGQPLRAPQLSAERQAPMFMRLAGLTSVCDWIASAEDHFPFAGDDVDLDAYAAASDDRAAAALQALGWTSRPDRPAPRQFKELFDNEPRPLQAIAERVGQQRTGPALFVIEAPTGEGKTEAALTIAHALAAAGQAEGFYVALPTQATSNQMFSRVANFLASQADGQRVNLQLLHGGAGGSSQLQERRWSAMYDPDTDGGVVAESWFTQRKRGLLSPFAVGTVDQALMAVLQTKHVFVRLAGLAGKCLIVDEVHAYDAYMSDILAGLLRWLRAMDCSVVLLSATLPGPQRQRLLEAWGAPNGSEGIPAYPRLTVAEGGSARTEVFDAARPRSVDVGWIDPSDLVDRLAGMVNAGANVAMVCSTVDRAQDLARSLYQHAQLDQSAIHVLHARFRQADRRVIEEAMLRRLGRHGDRPQGMIVIATQIIEQSLDIDFDAMVSDPAPIDLLIQRAGRLQRHNENTRPRGFETPCLHVVRPSVAGTGRLNLLPSEWVYDRHLLLRTYLALRDRDQWQEPQDIDPLIRTVYEGPPPQVDDDLLATDLKESAKQLEEKRLGEERIASQFQLPSPDRPDAISQLTLALIDDDDPRVHPDVRACTRLSTRPSVHVVLGIGEGHLLDLGDGQPPIDLDRRPAAADIQRLLGRSLPISHVAVAPALLDEEPAAPWRTVAALRFHRLIRLNEHGEAVIAGYRLRLDPDLGLIIKKQDTIQESTS